MLNKEAVVLGREEFLGMIKNPLFKRPVFGGAAEYQSANFASDSDIKILTSGLTHGEDTRPAQTDPLSLDAIIPNAAFTLSKNVFTYPIFSLPNHSLKETIQVSIQVDESGKVIMWSDDFGLCGVGDDNEEALQELEELIIADYHFLKNIPETDLSTGAKELLNRYKIHLA